MQPSLYSMTYFRAYNRGHYIWELFNILAKFPVTTSKVVFDIYNKHSIRIA